MIPLHLPYHPRSSASAVSSGLKPVDRLALENKLADFFKSGFGFQHVFFTKSCTSALESVAVLLKLKPGDEVIVPSYSYVSTANAFALHGAKIVFADSNVLHPNADADDMIRRITPQTKAVVVMHYGGVVMSNIDRLQKICSEKGIFLIEDAAHCIGAKGKPAPGTIGDAAVFSFHESKNLSCVEGGMLVLHHQPWLQRIEAILNKGTNRAMFERKETAVYEWVDTGSGHRMDVLHMSLLYGQTKHLSKITEHRLKLYLQYVEWLIPLKEKGKLDFYMPGDNTAHNAHIFWIRLSSEKERESLRRYLLEKKVYTTFHYLALHKSPYGKKFAGKEDLPNATAFEKCLLRIPLYYPLSVRNAQVTAKAIGSFFV